MKGKIFSLLTVIVVIAVMAMPTFASSSNFSFIMKHRVVDGSKNGEYHSFNGGTFPTLSGEMYQDGGFLYNNNLRNNVYVELRNKTSGNSFGEVNLGRPTLDGSSVDFSETFSKKTGGGSKYYLIVYRIADDGRVMRGFGTLED